ncbi:hypothetical protein CEUSTIGMA_g7763.t1 [Chlamydomonas eustigma]|uniref:Lipoxygenase domain-containing protein n=1 Tax=Chlamydomonas eustigma TaxID=1157962 RepID=A0A250XB58_9CHLO|nr:hypothetical protein CEUSTIGMA_g7763.t1 [Chlamydomonas eustigma]|eukprot:GAX80325.1 hypothetical protein CEUSTIGMA_g7763.t1 [Chlamydomonas eustigma]
MGSGRYNLPAVIVATSETNETSTLYAALAVISNFAASAVPSTNITIDGVTRQPMSIEELSFVTFEVCVQQQGWIIPATTNGAYLSCPGAPALNMTPVSFSEPEQLAMYLPENINCNSDARTLFGDTSSTIAKSLLTDMSAAASSLWEYNANDLKRVKALYGNQWQNSWTRLYEKGDLVELDLTFFEGIQTSVDAWDVAAHVLHKYKRDLASGKVQLVAIAVRLSNAPGPYPKRFMVYTPSKSKSAFILAMSMARTAMTMHLVWAGHFFNLHIIQGAFEYSLLNTIEQGVPCSDGSNVTHPLRQLLDHYTCPQYLAPFDFNVIDLSRFLAPHVPVTFNADERLLQLWNAYQQHNPLPGVTDFWGTTPASLARRSGLDASRFTSKGGEAWDLYPNLKLLIDLEAISTKFSKAALTAMYGTYSAVAADQKVNALAAAMIDPVRGNLRRINPSNKLDTIDKLASASGLVITLTFSSGQKGGKEWDMHIL